jgi:hypothetical protein
MPNRERRNAGSAGTCARAANRVREAGRVAGSPNGPDELAESQKQAPNITRCVSSGAQARPVKSLKTTLEAPLDPLGDVLGRQPVRHHVSEPEI